MSQQGTATYFDGQSNRKRKVQIHLGPALEIVEDGRPVASWPYGDVRRVDAAPGAFRLMCIGAPGLARLEIYDEATRQAVESRCAALTSGAAPQTLRIIAYSVAALASFLGLLFYGVPLLADRLAMVVPPGVEKRLGEAVDQRVRRLVGDKLCQETAGQVALARLVEQIQDAAGITVASDVQVLSTALPNAFALPGGRVYVSSGLLQKAANADEVAGVIAHELAHLQNRDGMRRLIRAGGTGFLVGILFGDVLGGGAVLFAANSLMTDSYSRDAERSADAFSIDAMRKLGRSPKAMGDLLLRVTGPQASRTVTILSSHPLTEERLAAMAQADQPVQGPELLTAAEWTALQGVCR